MYLIFLRPFSLLEGIGTFNTLREVLKPKWASRNGSPHVILLRAVARALLNWEGGVYSYIRVMPDGFLLKSVVFKLISKEISRAEPEYMNIPLQLL